MADPEDDVLNLTEDMEVEPDPQEEANDEGERQEETEETLSFGDEAEAPEEQSDLVQRLRAEIRERDRKLAAARTATVVEEAPVVVGPRPKAWDEGIDGDDEKLDAALDAWEARKTAAADQERKREDAKRRQSDEWGKLQARYNDEKAKITIAGRDEAEAAALAELSPQQQAVIARHADNPARFIIALGKNPATLAQIASIEDPFALTKAMTKMEATLKQTKGPRPPEPTRTVRGRAISISNTDKQLEKLEKEAERTGNRNPVLEFKRRQREAKK